MNNSGGEAVEEWSSITDSTITNADHYCIDNTSKTANTLLAPRLIAHLERRMRGGEELTSVVEHQRFAVVPGTRHGRGPGGRAPSSRAPRTLIEDFGSYSSRVELYGARQASDAGTEDRHPGGRVSAGC